MTKCNIAMGKLSKASENLEMALEMDPSLSNTDGAKIEKLQMLDESVSEAIENGSYKNAI